WRRAEAIGTKLLDESASGPRRAEVLLLLGDPDFNQSRDRAVELSEQALLEAPPRRDLQSIVHSMLAHATPPTKGLAAAREHARTALELADDVGDDALRAKALAMLGFVETV